MKVMSPTLTRKSNHIAKWPQPHIKDWKSITTTSPGPYLSNRIECTKSMRESKQEYPWMAAATMSELAKVCVPLQHHYGS